MTWLKFGLKYCLQTLFLTFNGRTGNQQPPVDLEFCQLSMIGLTAGNLLTMFQSSFPRLEVSKGQMSDNGLSTLFGSLGKALKLKEG